MLVLSRKGGIILFTNNTFESRGRVIPMFLLLAGGLLIIIIAVIIAVVASVVSAVAADQDVSEN